MTRSAMLYLLAAVACAGLGSSAALAGPADEQLARGKYLVTIIGCGDCHTPGAFFGHPDMQRFLGGAEVGMAIPGMGVFVPRNLTPDKDTGLGKWTTEQLVTTFTTGKRPDGRMLAPVMPWLSFSHLTKADALSIAVYLKSLPPVKNMVAGPFGPKDKPTVMVMPIIPGEVYADLPKPPGAPPK